MIEDGEFDVILHQYGGVGRANQKKEAKKLLRPVLSGLGMDRTQALRIKLRSAQHNDTRARDLFILVNEMAPAKPRR